jgi:plastocyanin
MANVDVPSYERPTSSTIEVNNMSFNPHDLAVPSESQVVFDFQEEFHTVIFDTPTNATKPSNINNGGSDTDAIPLGQKRTITVSGNPGGEIPYYCGIHGQGMDGVIHIT